MFKRPGNAKNSKEMYRVKGLGCQGPMLYYGIIRHLQMLGQRQDHDPLITSYQAPTELAGSQKKDRSDGENKCQQAEKL